MDGVQVGGSSGNNPLTSTGSKLHAVSIRSGVSSGSCAEPWASTIGATALDMRTTVHQRRCR